MRQYYSNLGIMSSLTGQQKTPAGNPFDLKWEFIKYFA